MFIMPQKRKTLAAVHACSGNDYMSSFFWKGKEVTWKLVLQNDKFLYAFYQLGLFNLVTDEVIVQRNAHVHFTAKKMKPLNLPMTKSAVPVTLKDRWYYGNVDATTDIDFCTFNFSKMLLHIQFVSRT